MRDNTRMSFDRLERVHNHIYGEDITVLGVVFSAEGERLVVFEFDDDSVDVAPEHEFSPCT